MNLKKIAAAGVAAVCAVSMAACGGSSSSGEATDLTYDQIKLGETGTDIKTTIKFTIEIQETGKKSLEGLATFIYYFKPQA